MAAVAKQAKPIVAQYFSTQKVGVVVSAGRSSKAVRVRVAGQEWNKRFRKHFPSPKTYLVSDPNNSLVEGDVVRISSGNRTSKSIHHVVTSIIAPFGEPVENRPPVFSQAQLNEIRVQKRLLKDVRSAERGREVSVRRLALAKKQGLRIPTLDEAMEGLRLHEEAEKKVIRSQGSKSEQPRETTEKPKEQGKPIKAEASQKQKVQNS